MSNKARFMWQVNQSFGSGGMSSSLENTHLTEYIQYLQRSHDGILPVKRAVVCTGRQTDGTWVLNADTFISPDGESISPTETNLVWLDKDLIFENDKVRSADISPVISHPLSTNPLKELVKTLEKIASSQLSWSYLE